MTGLRCGLSGVTAGLRGLILMSILTTTKQQKKENDMAVIWNNKKSGAVKVPVKAPAEMTVKELKVALDAMNLGYIASAKKAELLVMVEDGIAARAEG